VNKKYPKILSGAGRTTQILWHGTLSTNFQFENFTLGY